MGPPHVSGSHSLAVVGGGIVGLATARAAALGGERVIVLEAEPQVARHQSGRNSGVVHSGIYYPPGSEKAQLCTSGRSMLWRFCAQHEISARRCGKLIVAVEERQVAEIERLARRGQANGLTGLERLDGARLREREPAVTGIAGLWVPQTGVVDFRQVAGALAADVERHGGEVRTRARVVALRQTTDTVTIESTAGSVACKRMVNCAGLESDRVARLSGVGGELRILPFRGEYRALVPARRHLVRGLVYPVPDPELPFLGVHLTRTVDGRVLVGPNAVPAGSRYGYSRRDLAWRDVIDMVAFPGTWRLGRRLWRQGVGELWRAWSATSFLTAARRLLPDLQPGDLEPAPSGVRAQAVDRAGRLVDDFCFARSGRILHVLNAPSPAATAALAIGERIVRLLAA